MCHVNALSDDLIKCHPNSLKTAEEGFVTDAQPRLTAGPTPSTDTQASASTIQFGPEMRYHYSHSIPTHSHTKVCSNSIPSVHTTAAQSAHSAAEHSPVGGECRDLVLFNRREFKVHGGYIGDSSSDISYGNICQQIDEGLKEQHAEREIIGAVMRGHFKNMLICKDELIITELKSFSRSHIGEKGTAELFQELDLARQLVKEAPQQFL